MHIRIYNETYQKINYTSHNFTLEVPIVSCNDDNKILLSIVNDGKKIVMVSHTDNTIEARIWFNQRDTPIILVGYPKDMSNVSILICNSGNRITLWLDISLVDEDWPLGNVMFDGAICETMVGEWYINDEIAFNMDVKVSKDITDISRFKPEGHNTGVGDCMPFSHDDTFHLFYLYDRRGHKSKWGLGAHQWAHISTKDLKSWEQHPIAIAIDEQYEGSICTGSVVCHNGVFFAYYAVRMSDGSPARITWATSEDCVNFTKSYEYFELSFPYDTASARDPKVIIDENGTAHMFITTSIDISGALKGCLAHYSSKDMLIWEEKEPLIVLDIEDQPECSDYFYFKGIYYLIYSNYGMARYYTSKEPFGPWTSPENNIVMNPSVRVPKTAIFLDRVITVGFIVDPPEARYAGYFSFGEMIVDEDGTVSFTTPREYI